MHTPLAPGFMHMRPGLITAKGRRRYRRQGGKAPPRAVPSERQALTLAAIGAVPRGWKPRRCWTFRPPTPRRPAERRAILPSKPKPEAHQLALGF